MNVLLRKQNITSAVRTAEVFCNPLVDVFKCWKDNNVSSPLSYQPPISSVEPDICNKVALTSKVVQIWLFLPLNKTTALT